MVDKPIKPSEILPPSFGGRKENFSSAKIASGYAPDVPDILGGANLNYLIDTLGKKDTYHDVIVDFINNISIGETITVDENNHLVYKNLSDDNKANISLNNLSNNGKKVIDGQWRPLDVTAINNQTYPTTKDINIPLSSILPNDGYNYELLVSATGGTENQGEITRVFIKSSIITSPIGICEIKSPTNTTMYCYGSATIPIGTDRKLTVVRYTATPSVGTYYLYLRGYRRLGTNI